VRSPIGYRSATRRRGHDDAPDGADMSVGDLLETLCVLGRAMCIDDEATLVHVVVLVERLLRVAPQCAHATVLPTVVLAASSVAAKCAHDEVVTGTVAALRTMGWYADAQALGLAEATLLRDTHYAVCVSRATFTSYWFSLRELLARHWSELVEREPVLVRAVIDVAHILTDATADAPSRR
jgi:hypothetical protein